MQLKGTHYLLDTTVFNDFLRGKSEASAIIRHCLQPAMVCGYAIITEAELWAGIRGLRTTEEHELLLSAFTRYDLNVAIARRGGELRAKAGQVVHQRVPAITDCIIAATAEAHGLTVISRNTRDFNVLATYGIQIETYSLV